MLGAMGLLLAGCSSESSHDVGCPSGQRCDSSVPAGPARGKRADGSVDITAEQAWPARPVEPSPLTGLELAQACLVMAACSDFDPPDSGTIENVRRIALSLCAQPAIDAPSGTGPGSYFWEERAVPASGLNERWTFEARERIAHAASCQDVLAVQTARPKEIQCEEAGCWWTSRDKPIPRVTCRGDVATLTTTGTSVERDCARSFMRCDEASPTGCSDRAPIACDHPAADRCDGAVRLGCDGNGRVTFRDCARAPGGTCGATKDGLGCSYPDAGQCKPGGATCEGEALRLCVFGQPQLIDCNALGLAACQNGFCAAK